LPLGRCWVQPRRQSLGSLYTVRSCARSVVQVRSSSAGDDDMTADGFASNLRSGSKKGFATRSFTDDPLLNSMSEISAKDGRVPRTTNMVLSDESQDWRELDEKVNTYPCVREIKAIGLGGDEFAADVKRRVEEVIGKPLSADAVKVRPSSTGKYLSVTLQCPMENSGQVQAVYASLSQNPGLKWYL